MNSEKVKTAIERLKTFEPPTGYQIGYSGGKDSYVIKILAKLADVDHIVVHNLTTVDAPETVRYIKSQPDVIINRPPITMWKLIEKNIIPPTRIMRYCCSVLKERPSFDHRVLVTGVRWAESINRKKNQGMVNFFGKPKTTQKKAELIGADYKINKSGGVIVNDVSDTAQRLLWCCHRTNKIMVNPIIDWTDQDVWEFLHYYGCKSNPLYYDGENRVGCVGCPLAGAKGQKRDFARYPIYRKNYIKAFDRMIANRLRTAVQTDGWKTGEDVMAWWLDENPNQLKLFEE